MLTAIDETSFHSQVLTSPCCSVKDDVPLSRLIRSTTSSEDAATLAPDTISRHILNEELPCMFACFEENVYLRLSRRYNMNSLKKIHCVQKVYLSIIFWNNSAKSQPIVIIFGTKHCEES